VRGTRELVRELLWMDSKSDAVRSVASHLETARARSRMLTREEKFFFVLATFATTHEACLGVTLTLVREAFVSATAGGESEL
jgi:hypothetical protein